MQTNSYALSTKCARCSLGQVVIAELSRARSTMNKKILVNYPSEKSEFFFTGGHILRSELTLVH